MKGIEHNIAQRRQILISCGHLLLLKGNVVIREERAGAIAFASSYHFFSLSDRSRRSLCDSCPSGNGERPSFFC